jgi:hypothetical protein
MHDEASIGLVQHLDVRLTEDDEQVALGGGFELAAHVQVGVHARLEHRDTSQIAELAGARLVVERARDHNVEGSISCLACGGDEIRSGDCSELRADEDGGS